MAKVFAKLNSQIFKENNGKILSLQSPPIIHLYQCKLKTQETRSLWTNEQRNSTPSILSKFIESQQNNQITEAVRSKPTRTNFWIYSRLTVKNFSECHNCSRQQAAFLHARHHKRQNNTDLKHQEGTEAVTQ